MSRLILGLLVGGMLATGMVAADEAVVSGSAETASADAAASIKGASDHAALKKGSLPGTRNVHLAGNIVLAGQPSRETLAELADRGVKTVISLRQPAEERFDEASLCEQLGMKFVRLPIGNPDDLNQELIGNACTLLKSASDDSGVVLHCASANRVGAIWLVHRVKEHGFTVEQARDEAKRVGLKTPELESKAVEYLQSE